ncbi:MAG: DUF1549 and DUF1553 domain-containing protein [Pirellulales bacterium]|nr:DUF1549 and DUF1553 domain-containing protein [Pirellulales bacterium]
MKSSLLTLFLSFVSLNCSVGAELRVYPQEIRLHSTEATQTVVVQELQSDRVMTQVLSGVVLRMEHSDIAKVEGNKVYPLKNGETSLIATRGEVSIRVPVKVTGQQQEFRWSFRNHVESVLSKAGCNGGACHGARAGQNGFRLTLFGFDLAADYSYLTRQARGRRIVPSDPGRSLLLTKPTGALPHKGGVRLDVNEVEYRVLAEWIAAGAPGPADEDPVIERLEVLPPLAMQQVGVSQQLVVMAHFSDGHVEDVTRWSKYTSVDLNVATVGEHGKVQFVGPGEGAIKVWYLNLNALSFNTVPFNDQLVNGDSIQENNFIDEIVNRKLNELKVPVSQLCDDPTFIRRLFVDAMGVLPTTEELVLFLEDPRPSDEKRVALIDEVLGRPEFVDYWAYKWSDLLLVSGARLRPAGVEAYYKWIRERVANNLPWDELVRQVVTASGSALENGAANFYALHQSPEDMAETVAQAFMGLSINCAKCHNHPLEKWTNDQYYAMANMFSRVRAKGWGGDFRSGDGNRIVFSDTQGELIQPSTGRPQPPRPLDGDAVAFADTSDRRIALAQWLTSKDNGYFAKSITNRVWANYLGVGLVEPVDDMRVTNPASNQELLDAAADYLVQQNFDLRQLMRVLLNSATYQRSSVAVEGNAGDRRFYSRYYPRRLKAEVLLDAVSQVTGVPTEFKDRAKGTRALQLPDSSVDSYFLSTFGRPERIITCDCERTDEPSVTQVLHLYNGDTVNNKLQSKEGRIERLFAGEVAAADAVRGAYMEALSREPTELESQRLTEIIASDDSAEQRRLVLEDLYWSLLTSKEFIFNH